jgi:diguanylate cyclase (GGDEF)-like protein
MNDLVVDDNATLRGVVRDLLTEIGYRIVRFASDSECIGNADVAPELIDLTILDLRPKDASQVPECVASAFLHVPILVDSGCEPLLQATLEVLSATRHRHGDRDRRQSSRVRLEKTNHGIECIDPLTGIASRNHFDTLLSAEWVRSAHRGWPLSIAMLDLDFFHAFNERYGYSGGDACLRRVANALARCLRRPTDIVARYGGEKFVALLPDTDADEVCVTAERLRARVEQLRLPHAGSGCISALTASVGVATTLPSRDQGCRMLIASANRALVQAKEQGRNRICMETHAGPTVVKP